MTYMPFSLQMRGRERGYDVIPTFVRPAASYVEQRTPPKSARISARSLGYSKRSSLIILPIGPLVTSTLAPYVTVI